MKIYAIKDNKVGFGQIFTAENKYTALRAFGEAVNEPKSMYAKFTNDFALYEIGELDENSGVITSTVNFVEEGINLKREQ